MKVMNINHTKNELVYKNCFGDGIYFETFLGNKHNIKHKAANFLFFIRYSMNSFDPVAKLHKFTKTPTALQELTSLDIPGSHFSGQPMPLSSLSLQCPNGIYEKRWL